MNFKPFGDRLVGDSILVRKRLDLRPSLEVHFVPKGFGYLDIRERPINDILCCHRIGILNIEFQAISRSLVRGFNPGT